MLWHWCKKSCFSNEITTLAIFIVALIVCRFFKISCIFYRITSYQCPACNMTRALLSLVKGDINAYMNYNIMALPVASVFMGELFKDIWGKHKKYFRIYACIILGINFIYYAYRVFWGHWQSGQCAKFAMILWWIDSPKSASNYANYAPSSRKSKAFAGKWAQVSFAFCA